MTYRERMENKLEKRREWADKADVRSGARLNAAHNATAGIPFGQPILVGHHSERRHRAAIARSDSNMRRRVEEANLAAHHRGAADGLERALDKSIFSDDPDAVEAIESRIDANIAKRERMKTINKLYRKGDAAKLAELGIDYEKMKERLNGPNVMSWCRIPYAAYELSNLGGRITADKKRLDIIKIRKERADAADRSPGGVTIVGTGDYVSITFAEKPDRGTLDALKAAGFRWGLGSWSGPRVNIPADLAAKLAYDMDKGDAS